MRGRKIDNDFLSEFISKCVANNKNSSDDILNEALRKISYIDNKIKEIEKLKVKRGKLLDVIYAFEKATDSQKESKIASLFDVSDYNICKFICNNLKNEPINMNDSKFQKQDILFAIKQLLKLKVISKIDDVIVKGEMFNNYIKFVMMEK
jgi:hypothetical protein